MKSGVVCPVFMTLFFVEETDFKKVLRSLFF